MTRSRHLKHTGRSPARAGFTRHGLPPPLLRRDHPRSRGVYSCSRARVTASAGSSPLARGLLFHDARRLLRRGIIPARAGFTTLPSAATKNAYGSSPLARGLLGGYPLGLLGFGIIPARAGFTVRRRPRSTRWWDHPRSRGVYRGAFLCLPGGLGSSPLARGLPRSMVGR